MQGVVEWFSRDHPKKLIHKDRHAESNICPKLYMGGGERGVVACLPWTWPLKSTKVQHDSLVDLINI